VGGRRAVRSSQRDNSAVESCKGRIQRGPYFFTALLFAGAGVKLVGFEKEIMNSIFAWALGGWEVIVVLVVVLILFGAKKIPELAKGLGQGIKEFKKATKEVTEEIQNAPADTTAQTGKPSAAISSQPASTVPQNSNPPKA
jgi:sec-independent protein translocase protein TatA